jgi:hypothetical protein
MIACARADHGSLGMGIFLNRTTSEAATLLGDLRQACIIRPTPSASPA